MVRVHAHAYLSTAALHQIVGPNVSWAPSAPQTKYARIRNVSLPAQDHVDVTQIVESSIIVPYVLVKIDTLEIRSPVAI